MSHARDRVDGLTRGVRRRSLPRLRFVILAMLAVLLLVALVVYAAITFVSVQHTSAGASPLSRVSVRDVHSLVLAPGSPETALFGHHDGVLKSSDGGRTWQAAPSLAVDAMNLAIPRRRPDVVYLAGHDVFLRSEDGGTTWRNVTNTLPGLDLHWFAVHPDDPGRLYVQAAGSGLFESVDAGATWARWGITVPEGESFTALTVLGGVPVNVLAGTEDGRLLYSHDGGQNWEQVARFKSMVTTFALNADARTVYLGTLDGVYRSEDGGVTWGGLPLKKAVRALAAAGAMPEAVLLATEAGEVFRLEGDATREWRVR